MRREVPLNVEAGIGAARVTSCCGLGGFSCFNDVEENVLYVSVIFPLLINHSLLLRINLKLDSVDLPFSILPIHLIMHTEE